MSVKCTLYFNINGVFNNEERVVMNIPEDYAVLFVQGGASQQFAAVPLNLMTSGKADYIVTGNFAGKAQEEAQKYGEAKIVASSKDANFSFVPSFVR